MTGRLAGRSGRLSEVGEVRENVCKILTMLTSSGRLAGLAGHTDSPHPPGQDNNKTTLGNTHTT